MGPYKQKAGPQIEWVPRDFRRGETATQSLKRARLSRQDPSVAKCLRIASGAATGFIRAVELTNHPRQRVDVRIGHPSSAARWRPFFDISFEFGAKGGRKAPKV